MSDSAPGFSRTDARSGGRSRIAPAPWTSNHAHFDREFAHGDLPGIGELLIRHGDTIVALSVEYAGPV